MIKFSIFLLFFIVVNAYHWDILKIVEENIDDSINPCDDFYRHVCSKSGPEDLTWYNTMLRGYQEDLDEIAKKYIPKKLLESVEKLTKISKNGFSTVPKEQIGEKYLEICQTNSTKALVFLKKLEQFVGIKPNGPCFGRACFSNLALDPNCQRASKTLTKGAALHLNHQINVGNIRISYFAQIYNNGLATLWSLRHQDEFRQINQMFLFFKDELLKSIEKTPWLLNTETMKIFRSIANQMYYTLPNDRLSENINHIFNYQIAYEDCVRTYEVLGDIATQYCVIHSLQDEEEESLNVVNAYNSHPELGLFNTFVTLMSNNGSLALKYGSVGAALAHEMGHSVILNDLTDGFYPYYSEEVNSCIQEQFNKSCNIYKEGSCDVSDMQIDENGSDIFGFPFAYERLKQKMGDEIYEQIPESKRGLTHAKAFFHLVFNIGCQRGDVNGIFNDEHGTRNIRINAGVIQIPEFEKVFNCSKDSRMVQSRKKQCHVFGENAPQK